MNWYDNDFENPAHNMVKELGMACILHWGIATVHHTWDFVNSMRFCIEVQVINKGKELQMIISSATDIYVSGLGRRCLSHGTTI